MSYLVFKQPLPPDQIAKSLNEQMLQFDHLGIEGDKPKQGKNSKQIDDFFNRFDNEFKEFNDNVDYLSSEENKD